MLEAATQFLRRDEEVRNDDDQRSLPDGFGQFVQHRHQLRRAARLRLLQHVEDVHQVSRVAARRDVLDHAVGHAVQSDRISLLACQVAQGPGDLARISILVRPSDPKSIEPLVSSTRQHRRLVSASNSLT